MAIFAAFLTLALATVYTFTGHPVQIAITPEPAERSLSGGLQFRLGDRFLLQGGRYELRARLEGHHPLEETLRIDAQTPATVAFQMRPLPGLLEVTLSPNVDASLLVDGVEHAELPAASVEIERGTRELTVLTEMYLPATRTVEVEGLHRRQNVAFTLEPAWSDVQLHTVPEGAEIRIDGEPTGDVTPITARVLAGDRLLTLHAPGYKTARRRLSLTAGVPLELPEIRLDRIDGMLVVHSSPAGATVTVDDVFQGSTPVEIELPPGQAYRVDVFRAGFETARRQVRLEPGVARRLDVTLAEVLGDVEVDVTPGDARVFVDGRDAGPASQVLHLTATEHSIEIRKSGFATWRGTVTPRPGIPQRISLQLKTLEEARLAAMLPEITAANGLKLHLMQPGAFSMGASRREPGRRANEVLRDVTLTRPFYLATTETTNAQFLEFRARHSSGAFEGQSLDGESHPAVNLSWDEAALFCNWLSARDGLPPAYRTNAGRVVGFDPASTGYRLPTEAEWSWAARVQPDGSVLRYPWGQERSPPRDRIGNYADRTAVHLLARTINGYTDGELVTAPVGRYPESARGLHDVGGNVAEWTNDFYAATSEELPSGVTDPLGPGRGQYHVIRGSSWMHGQIVDLRFTFRDFGTEGRPDVGFRIARWFE